MIIYQSILQLMSVSSQIWSFKYLNYGMPWSLKPDRPSANCSITCDDAMSLTYHTNAHKSTENVLHNNLQQNVASYKLFNEPYDKGQLNLLVCACWMEERFPTFIAIFIYEIMTLINTTTNHKRKITFGFTHSRNWVYI